MNRDEILAKSRNENKGADEMAKQVKLKAASVSRAVGFFLCCIGALVANLLDLSIVVALVCWMVYWGMLAAEGWVLAAGLKTRWGWLGALANTIFFVAFTALFIVRAVQQA